MVERRPFGLMELNRYPLFAPEFLDFLRRLLPPNRHAELVASVMITARKPEDKVENRRE